MSENPVPAVTADVPEWCVSTHRTPPEPSLILPSSAVVPLPASGTALASPVSVMEVFAFGRGGKPIPQSVAVCAGDAAQWLLLNACAEAGRDPRLLAAARNGSLRAVVLMDQDFEHAAGLLALCEGATLDVYATPAVFEGLTNTLPALGSRACAAALRWHLLPVAGDVRSAAFGVPGFEAYHLRAIADASAAAIGERVAIQLDDAGADRCLLYMPGELPVWLSIGQQRFAQDAELRP